MLTERWFAFDNLWADLRHLSVELDEVSLTFWDVLLVKDGFDRAFWCASLAVDAMFRVDKQHLLALMEAFARANDDAVGVLAAKAGFGHNECHDGSPSNGLKCGSFAREYGFAPSVVTESEEFSMTDRRQTSDASNDVSTERSFSESVLLLERFREGNEQSATELFRRFAARLESLVQSRLSKKLARRVDAEDVVLSAYRSFFVRARAGRFEVDEPGDLWRLLAQITLNKLYRSAEWNSAARRTQDREQGNAADLGDQAIDATASHELAVMVADQLEHLMSQLTEATSHVLELRLQGHDVDEIAALVGRSPRTVRRQLEAIRSTFAKLAGSETEDRSPNQPERASVRLEPHKTGASALRLIDEVSAERRTLDEFVLRRQIGLGLTGRVYEAFDKRQEKLVAVKVLRKSWLADRSLRERFESEADIVARLDHPGIVRIHGHGESPNGGWFIVMDLLPGGDLTAHAGLSLPVEQAVGWVREVASAVSYAHREGVIHCDLKPANLLLSMDEHVVVTDFGFAQSRETLGRHACIAGTPAFMAPEQIDDAWGQVGRHTDIYGVGAVLFFLLTGRPPVHGSRVREVLDEVTSQHEIEGVTELRPDVPPQWVEVCRRCLRKSPRERFQEMDELVNAFR